MCARKCSQHQVLNVYTKKNLYNITHLLYAYYTSSKGNIFTGLGHRTLPAQCLPDHNAKSPSKNPASSSPAPLISSNSIPALPCPALLCPALVEESHGLQQTSHTHTRLSALSLSLYSTQDNSKSSGKTLQIPPWRKPF